MTPSARLRYHLTSYCCSGFASPPTPPTKLVIHEPSSPAVAPAAGVAPAAPAASAASAASDASVASDASDG